MACSHDMLPDISLQAAVSSSHDAKGTLLEVIYDHIDANPLFFSSHQDVWTALSQRAAWWINKHIPDRQIDHVHPILTKRSGDKKGGLKDYDKSF